MSKERGREVLSSLIAKRFAGSGFINKINGDFRKELDTRIVLVDISQRALSPNKIISKKSFDDSYAQFQAIIVNFLKAGRLFNSIEEFDTAVSSDKYSIQKRGVALISSTNLFVLAGLNFDSIRRFISSQVSEKMGSDTYFGTTKRKVRYDEIASSLDEANATGYAASHRAKYGIPDTKSIFTTSGYLADGTGKILVMNRSNLDIGHMFSDVSAGTVTPLSEKLSAISTGNFSESAISSAKEALEQLQTLHAKFAYKYHNMGIVDGVIKGTAILAVSLHHYKLNRLLARKETRIYQQFINKLASETIGKNFTSVPGSNTLKQDIGASIRDAVAGGSGNIKPHEIVSGMVDVIAGSSKARVSTGLQKLNSPPKLRTTTGQFYSLITLKDFINYHLQNVISANMGNGSQRDILNYRTGRFAESVKVEHMSQSREGMITAFYSYMKNPYQTFEPGFRQGLPTSRDPKLLIAKSIREIAAEKVANRMRAVAI